MSRKLIVSSIAVSFAVSMLAIAGVFTGAEINLGAEATYSLTEFAPHVALFALAGGAFLGSRDPSDYETWEGVAVAAAVAIPAVVYLDVTQAVDLIDSYHPYSGLAAVLVGFIGYHAVSFRGSSGSSLSEEI